MTPSETQLLLIMLTPYSSSPSEVAYMKFMLWVVDGNSDSESVNRLKTELSNKSLIPDKICSLEGTTKDLRLETKTSFNNTSSGPDLISESDDFGFILRTKITTISAEIVRQCRLLDENQSKLISVQMLIDILYKYLTFKPEEEEWLRKFIIEISGNQETANYEDVLVFFTGGLPESDNIMEFITISSQATEDEHLKQDDLKYSESEAVLPDKFSRKTSKASIRSHYSDQKSNLCEAPEAILEEAPHPINEDKPEFIPHSPYIREISDLSLIAEDHKSPDPVLSEEDSFERVEVEGRLEEEKYNEDSQIDGRYSAISYTTQDTASTGALALQFSHASTHPAMEASFEDIDN
jgi:hypothetical protein